jgi:class 3 adenylate cyclase
MAGSTKMVDSHSATFCAEMYKCYLYCAGRIINFESGEITAYDGDRVMAVFIGELKNTRAVRTAMKINFARSEMINPAINNQYPNTFSIHHAIGIDTAKLMVARTGVRGANDLVWVGKAANYAAKLSDLDADYTWITKSVYDSMADEVKISNGQNMWEARTWTAMDGLTIYRSHWWWRVS